MCILHICEYTLFVWETANPGEVLGLLTVQLFCENVHTPTCTKQKQSQCLPVPSSLLDPRLPPKYTQTQCIRLTAIYRSFLKGTFHNLYTADIQHKSNQTTIFTLWNLLFNSLNRTHMKPCNLADCRRNIFNHIYVHLNVWRIFGCHNLYNHTLNNHILACQRSTSQ